MTRPVESSRRRGGGPVNARLLPLADTALTLEFDAPVTPELSLHVLALARRLLAERDAGALAGVVDVIPAFRALTVCVEPARVDRAALQRRLQRLAGEAPGEAAVGRHWRLPVCYQAEFAPDLGELADRVGLAPEAVVAEHSAARYRVLVIGFAPGFPYMGPLPPKLRLPRRATPHLRVPAGTVAVANEYTAIYPWQSPGGWHLIGRSPLPLFDPSAASPALLQAGDAVRFEPVDGERFARLRSQVDAGRLDVREFVEDEPR